MGRFYLDMEYTNGNFYLADIIEISLVAEKTAHEFHSYVTIPYRLPANVKALTCITDEKLIADGCSFYETMCALVDFISIESTDPPTIIAHGGYHHDFPILFANCHKYGFQDFHVFHQCTFVDSVQLLQDLGYKKPSLTAMCNALGLSRMTHSASKDAYLLKYICNRLRLIPTNGYSILDISNYLCLKMPLAIPMIFQLMKQCTSSHQLKSLLLPYVWKKTALNAKQVGKISHVYFTYYH